MSSQGHFRTNSAWMMFLAVAQRLVGTASTMVVSNALGPSQLGAYAVTTTTASNAYGVARLGVDMGVHVLASSRDPAHEALELERLLGVATTLFLGIAILGAVGCALLSKPVASELFKADDLLPFVQIAGILFLGQVIAQLAYVVFAGLHTFRAYARVMMVGTPIAALATALTALLSGALMVALVAGIAQFLLGFGLMAAAIRTAGKMGLQIRPRLAAGPVVDILKIGLPFYLTGLIALPVDYAAQAGLVRQHGISTLGDLRVVVAVVAIVSLLPGALNGPMISAFSRIQLNTRNMDVLFSQTLRSIWTAATFGSLAVGLAWPLAVRIFGAEYHNARSVGFIALAYGLAVCLRNVWANRLLSTRRQGLLVAVNTADAAVFALGAVLLIPKLGLLGYLIAQAAGATSPLLAAAAVVCSRRERAQARFYLSGAMLTFATLALVAWFNLGHAGLAAKLGGATAGALLLGGAWVFLMATGAERHALLAAVRSFADRRLNRIGQ